MAKKTTGEEPTENPVKEILEEAKEEKKSEKTIEVKSDSNKIPLKVYRIEDNELVLEDSKGNGIRIPLPEQYRNVKPGDIIYL